MPIGKATASPAIDIVATSKWLASPKRASRQSSRTRQRRMFGVRTPWDLPYLLKNHRKDVYVCSACSVYVGLAPASPFGPCHDQGVRVPTHGSASIMYESVSS